MYSIGFYVDDSDEDRVRDLKVRMKRAGLRAIHPGKYLFRSPGAKRESLLRAAWIAPEMFQSGIVRAHVFPLRPEAKSSWNALLAVSFPVPLAAASGPEVSREFGAVLTRGSDVTHRFSRRIALLPDGPNVTSEPVITFLEPVSVSPGSYTVTALMSDPRDVNPHTARVEIEVPAIPKREMFLIGPVLGRPSGANLVVTGGGRDSAADRIGSEASFEPLLVQRVDAPVDLVAFTQACLVDRKKRRRHGGATIRRSLRADEDRLVGELASIELELDGEGPVRCGNLVDVLPATSLGTGEYTFDAVLDPVGRGEGDAESVRFAVTVPEPDS